MQRNQVYKALSNQLAVGLINTPPWNVLVVSRGFVSWSQADLQPAIYVVPVKESSQYQRGLPNKWLVQCDVYVYCRWTTTPEDGAEALANLMDGVDYVLSPTGPNAIPPVAVNTLGGLVSYCALQGSGEVSIGFLNQNQAVARMPVEILIPG